jgi:signal peptidase I
VLGAFAVALIIKTFLIQAFYIPSPSMFPTLQTNDRVLVNKLSYELHDVNRGDLVVFERPPGETDTDIKDLIKRVIGLPGDVVSSCGGHVCIDGTPLEEPYLPDGVTTGDFERVTIPEGQVFVMGDNRENSSDSRIFGPIDEDTIVGRAFVRIWPLSELDLL